MTKTSYFHPNLLTDFMSYQVSCNNIVVSAGDVSMGAINDSLKGNKMAKNTPKIYTTHIRSKKIKFQLELRKRLETLQELDDHQKESKTEH